MSLQGVVDQTERLIEAAKRQARDVLNADAEIEEPNAGELWKKTSPQLEKALAIYAREESEDTPQSSWIPFVKRRKAVMKIWNIFSSQAPAYGRFAFSSLPRACKNAPPEQEIGFCPSVYDQF
jgi:hypothetical protein